MNEDSLKPLVYIVDDEQSLLDSLTILLKRRGDYQVRTFVSLGEALEGLDGKRPDVVLSDIALAGGSEGLEVLKQARNLWPEVPVILMSAVAGKEEAIQAVNEGAYHFLEKPFNDGELVGLLRKAVATGSARRTAKQVAQRSKHAQSKRHNHPGARRAELLEEWQNKLIGESESFQEVLALVQQAAQSEATVLFEGESGTGKGVLATYLHELSSRKGGSMMSINCGAFTETLLESQIFGHKKGAFTGADSDYEGLVRTAEGGSFFLDEVSEMSPKTQVRFLHVLQEREVIPVGGTEARDVDVRFIAATNRNLREEVRRGNFRNDLFFRLNVFSIEVPPLREREGDIPLLARHALAKLRARDAELSARQISDEAMEVLKNYSWPGNVRELENAIQRASIVSHGEIQAHDLPGHVHGEETSPAQHTRRVSDGQRPTALGRGVSLAEMEKAYIHWVYHQNDRDIQATAQRLDVPVGLVQQALDDSSETS